MVTGQISTSHRTYNLGQAQVSVVIGQNGTDTGHTVVTGQLLVTVW